MRMAFLLTGVSSLFLLLLVVGCWEIAEEMGIDVSEPGLLEKLEAEGKLDQKKSRSDSE